MGFFRKLTIGLAHLLLFASLAYLGAALAILHTIGQPGPLEHALAQTNIYSGIVTNFVRTHEESTMVGIPLTVPAVQTAVERALPTSVVEPAGNQLISGVYAWIQGKRPTITFKINLTGTRTNLANSVQQLATQRAAALPTCTDDQLLDNPGLAYQTPLAATCLPPAITATEIGSDAKQAILSSSFLKSPLTPQSLSITSDGSKELKLPVDKNKSVSLPSLYHRFVESIYILSIVAIVCGTLMIWLYRDHLKSARRVGATVGWVGGLCVIDAFITGEVPNWLNPAKVTSSGQRITSSLQQSITKAVTILVEDMHRWLLWYGATLFIVGVGAWAGILVLQRRRKSDTITPKPTQTSIETS